MGRKRTLKEINHILEKDSTIIESTLSNLCAGPGTKPLKVLEVGFGHGRALLELAYGFREHPVDFYGINLKPQKSVPLTKSEDLIQIAIDFGVASRENLKNFQPPTIFFYDATNLDFVDESLDLIYSAVSIRFIENKAHFLEEVCRVLRPGGIALLHLGESGWNYPYGLASQDKQLTSYRNRFIVKHGKELIPLPDYLKLCEGNGFEFKFLDAKGCVLKVTKQNPGQLDLQLKLNSDFSAPMREFLFENTKKPRPGGFRTVYDISPENYQALIEKGLLGKLDMVSR